LKTVTFVKVCGLTTPDAVRCAGELGVDAVGFVFAPSPRQVTAAEAAALVRLLPPTVTAVGVFKGQAPEEIARIAREAGITTVQVHDLGSEAETAYLRGQGLDVYRAVAAGTGYELRGASRLLVDGAVAGSGEAWNWRGLERPEGEWILAGGLTPTNVAAALAATGAAGVDVSSGVESERGVKDLALIREFVAAARG
jgi:phosphoribosylanthranilate isomerase